MTSPCLAPIFVVEGRRYSSAMAMAAISELKGAEKLASAVSVRICRNARVRRACVVVCYGYSLQGFGGGGCLTNYVSQIRVSLMRGVVSRGVEVIVREASPWGALFQEHRKSSRMHLACVLIGLETPRGCKHLGDRDGSSSNSHSS